MRRPGGVGTFALLYEPMQWALVDVMRAHGDDTRRFCNAEGHIYTWCELTMCFFWHRLGLHCK